METRLDEGCHPEARFTASAARRNFFKEPAILNLKKNERIQEKFAVIIHQLCNFFHLKPSFQSFRRYRHNNSAFHSLCFGQI
jgi:hypothetical protein